MTSTFRRLKRVIRRVLPAAPEPQGVQVIDLDGVQVPLDFSQHTHRMVYHRRQFEAELTGSLLKTLRAGDVFLDIGANFGWHSLQLAVRRPEIRAFYAFEPSARSFALLERGIAANQLEGRINAHNLALGREKGSATLKHFAGLGLVNASIYPLADLEFEEETIEIDSLDTWVPTFEAPPTVIKCDVEGSELDVLHGAEGLLSGHFGPPPMWFLEANYETSGMAGYFPWQMIEVAQQFSAYRGYMLREGGIHEMPHLKALRHGETLILAVPEHHGDRLA